MNHISNLLFELFGGLNLFRLLSLCSLKIMIIYLTIISACKFGVDERNSQLM